MKKKLLAPFMLLLASSMLVACGGGRGSSDDKKDPEPTPTPEPTPDPDPMGGDGPVIPEGVDPEDRVQKYYFYKDFSHIAEPIYILEWWQNQPIGGAPQEVREAMKTPSDPLFPVFLGFSRYPSSVDNRNIWNFEEDSAILRTIKLYGIWVAND